MLKLFYPAFILWNIRLTAGAAIFGSQPAVLKNVAQFQPPCPPLASILPYPRYLSLLKFFIIGLLLNHKARIVNNNYWSGNPIGMKMILVGNFCR
jgi:hypothetical protein